MKYETATILMAFLGLISAVPLVEREVPQEHSHEAILRQVKKSLDIDNPDKIVDPVFGLLGDKAASQGAGSIKNLDCLQRSIADRAFTNEKKAGNTNGMANALLYAALEKNTGAVGKPSNICKDDAVNPEINAITQHQDPAGPGALEKNKQIVLDLAVQLASIGADPQLAARSATFAPGKTDDPTAAGNTCDDQDDKAGCIFTKKLIQVEATPDEIDQAVKAVGGGKKPADSGKKGAQSKKQDAEDDKKSAQSKNKEAEDEKKSVQSKGKEPEDEKKIVQSKGKEPEDEKKSVQSKGKEPEDEKKSVQSKGKEPEDEKKSAPSIKNVGNDDKEGRVSKKGQNDKNNVQTFTGKLGGVPPPVIETAGSDRPFSVKEDTFVKKAAALSRSCAIQHNACGNAANAGGGFPVSDCDAQENQCNSLAKAAA